MLVASGAAGSGSGLPLQTVARVPLSGPAVRFDYTSVDPGTNRLWVAHMDADQLLAVDLRTRRIVLTVAAPGVHGVIAVPALGRVYASATNAQQVLTIDARTGKILARAPAGQYPDGLAYDPVERHVFVSDESGGVETVIDAAGRRLATIPLGGEAGNVQYDPGSRHILADVQTRDDIAVIDPRTNRIVRRIAVPGCVSDHGLSVDTSRELAFVACDGNATLHTLDLRTHEDGPAKPPSATPPTCSRSTVGTAGSTSPPRAATSPSSPRPPTASDRSASRSSPPRRTPSPSTPAPTSSTSPSRAAARARRSSS